MGHVTYQNAFLIENKISLTHLSHTNKMLFLIFFMRGVYENNTDSLSHTKEKCFFSFFFMGGYRWGSEGDGTCHIFL